MKVDEIQKTVEGIPTDELRSFVLSYAIEDKRFMRNLMIKYGEPDIKSEISAIKERMREAVRKGTSRGFIGWSGCNQICDALDEISDEGLIRLEQGYIRPAYMIGLTVLLRMTDLLSKADTSSGAWDYTIHHALELIEKACEMANDDSDKKFIFETSCKEARNKVFDGWGEWNFILLRSVARFATEANVRIMESTLDFLRERDIKGDSYYSDSDDRLTRLEICKYLNDNETYTSKLYENLDIDEVREILIINSISAHNFSEGERLCLEIIDTIEDRSKGTPYHWTRVWYAKLYEVYLAKGDYEKQIELARKLLICEKDIHYYTVLKGLLAAKGDWESEYSSLLEALSAALPPYSFMGILRDESETDLLMQELQKYPREVYTFGPFLSAKYPDKVFALYGQEIRKDAEDVSERKGYHRLCKQIIELGKLGGKEDALKLIAELADRYCRRPAMLDELQKVEHKLGLC